MIFCAAVDLLAARSDVDPANIRASGRLVKGIWAVARCGGGSAIGKVWLDRSPYSLRAALHNTLNTNLFDAVIPGFALRWDLDDLVKAMGEPLGDVDRSRELDEPGGEPSRSLRVSVHLGDTTDLADAQDDAYIEEFLK